jgi:sterol desaturase/sphingolipid hydroxylase (fatty acid hydroxylase superfamily)
MLVKMAAAAALGAPPEGVLAFEIILNAASLFEHAAIRLPPALDRALALVIVTPRLHRIHHSEREEETNSHYGFCLSVWDRLFGTWRGRWEGELVLGVRGWRAAEEQTLPRLLVQPFRRGGG